MDNIGLYPATHGTVIIGDTETTGLALYGVNQDTGMPTEDPDGPDRLCSASFIKIKMVSGNWKVQSRFFFKVDPQRPIGYLASKVNGFGWSGSDEVADTLEDLYGLDDFSVVAPALLSFLSDIPLVFHNTAFDVSVLDAELVRAGFPEICQPVICTKKAFSDIQGKGRPHQYVKGTNLNDLCTLLGVDKSTRVGPNGEELHGAEVDAHLCLECFVKLNTMGWILPEFAQELPHRVSDWRRYLEGNQGIKP